jgi:4-hydroxybenzoate polyprenyltransferase
LGDVAGWLGLALTVLVIVAQVLRRLASFATVLPPVCRLMLYLIGASAGAIGVAGGPIWCGLALAIYILGAHYLARQKNALGPERHWPILLLAVPICLALIVDDDGARAAGLLLSAVLALWMARCLRPALWSDERDFDGALAGLVAGIALVDLLAVADAPKPLSAVFIASFLAIRGLQHVSTR